MDAPLITIFVRHNADCKYAGDEFCKRCQCKKHLRWTMHGKQFRKKTGSRSWAGAEEAKRSWEAQLTGKAPERHAAEALLLSQAIETFRANKDGQGLEAGVLSAHARELKRLLAFSEGRGLFTVKQALTMENLIAYRATWPLTYKSSESRSVVQTRLVNFLKFCDNANYLDKAPRLSPIKIDQPETEPLTDADYEKIIAHAEGKLRTVVRLMRMSGLSVRDACTLKRTALSLEPDKDLYRVISKRVKTKTPLYIPIPKSLAEELLTVANGNPVYVFWDPAKDVTVIREKNVATFYSQEISKVFTAAGVYTDGHMVSHRLRDTYAVDLLTKGVPLEHVSKLLGHTSILTTERRYAKWVKGRQDRLDALVSATWKK